MRNRWALPGAHQGPIRDANLDGARPRSLAPIKRERERERRERETEREKERERREERERKREREERRERGGNT